MSARTVNEDEVYERCLLPFILRNDRRVAQKNSDSLTHRLSTARLYRQVEILNTTANSRMLFPWLNCFVLQQVPTNVRLKRLEFGVVEWCAEAGSSPEEIADGAAEPWPAGRSSALWRSLARVRPGRTNGGRHGDPTT